MPSEQPRVFAAKDLVVLTGADVVRKRPRMYYGVDQDDPALPGAVLRSVVQGVLHVPPARESLEIVVTISGDLVFSVHDNGGGMSPHTGHPAQRPDPEAMLTTIHAGHDDRAGEIGPAATLCRRVEVWTHWEGVAYATEMAADRTVTPLRELGPATEEGTKIRMWLDPEYFAPGARLPVPTSELTDSLLEARKRPADRVTFIDERLSGLRSGRGQV
ncbi:DNA gyrase/topoisomerase IV subunit B [Hamadaea flava]|uniref:ATP-binding protein n=1 Tax=Hamadaea flava TaxID=1742688 RepID=A0ABV8LLH8_9ACTN|nr:hypothetical protein [Hamadaea flava]MCP2323785.1 DNA gyrase/topoisomerase IV subunit B [Hamadaea flava]